ncbi:MAG: pectinesterase family protein [Bacteroidota bacterium]|nr:pectinesterase family protein [Bacteroidota bacterium]
MISQNNTNNYDIIVSQDGTGNYATVQDALNVVPDNSESRTLIFIKKGTYKEKIILRASKKNVTIIGENVGNVILTYDDYSGKIVGGDTLTTFTSYSFFIQADGFSAENITFENSAGPVGQAVAVMVKGDRVIFKNCRFLGHQDTFYTQGVGRCYLDSCYIEGTTDFIFGSSIVVFNRCILQSKKNSYITAASTPEGNKFGYVFFNCKLTAADGIDSVYLGRPWRIYAKTVFIECELGNQIKPEGWHNWKKPEAEKTTFYAEYKCFGAGSLTNNRVEWSRQLSDIDVAEYTLEKIFAADASATPYKYDWNPFIK